MVGVRVGVRKIPKRRNPMETPDEGSLRRAVDATYRENMISFSKDVNICNVTVIIRLMASSKTMERVRAAAPIATVTEYQRQVTGE